MKKIMSALCSAFLVGAMLACAIRVSASCTSGYDTATLSVKANPSIFSAASATGTVTRCDCSPVNNELSVFIRIQYNSGGFYYWYPTTEGTYYFLRQYNVDQTEKKIDCPARWGTINYAEAIFPVRCGSNPVTNVVREWGAQ